MIYAAPKRRKTLLYVLIGVLGLLIVAAVWKARQKPKGEEVNVEKVQKRTIRETVSASGKVFPETEVKISSDVSGEIVELYVEEGDSVVAGQVMAKIRPDEYQSAVERGQAAVNSARSQRDISKSNVTASQAQIEQLRADVARFTATLDQARKAHQRNDKLFKEGVISEAEFETSLSSLRSQESSLTAAQAALRSSESSLSNAKENVNVSGYGITSAQASLNELRTSLQKTVVTAPVSGIISKLNIEKGERVVGTLQMTGTEMMRIANLQSMEVQVEVSENDILKVSLGDEADVEVDAYLGRKFKGKVSEIANSASNITTATGALNTDQVTNFVVKIRIDPTSYADLVTKQRLYPFRPGMSAAVDIYTNSAEGTLSIPLIAVTVREEEEKTVAKDDKQAPQAQEASQKTTDEIKEIVFVFSADTVGIREVKTGIQDNDYIQILSGLEEGETVVSGPYSAISRKLKAGSQVTIADENAKNEKKGFGKKDNE